MDYLAKSYDNGEHIETIDEHTQKLIYLFNHFKNYIEQYCQYYDKKIFDKKELDLIYIACELHDLGKINYKFQKNINKNFKENKEIEKLYQELNIKNIPHGVLSCTFINAEELKEKYNFDDEDIQILASSIFNHHTRKLLDNKKNRIESKRLNKIVEKDLKYNLEIYNKIYNKNLYCDYDGIEENLIYSYKDNNLSHENFYKFWLRFIIIKGMLNKLDYAASAYDEKIEIQSDDASKKVLEKFKPNECQEYMLQNQNNNIVVIASTGIGKTEGALLWAGNSKTFYTLPLKVSINAIYDRIKENYYDSEKITFLHSDSVNDMLDNDMSIDDVLDKYNKSKKLSFPFTVCTIDQLFYFVFKSLGTEIFPATLKYSKLIIYEIQSYTPEITAFIIYGLKVINDIGGKFCIMTATLPPIIKKLMEENNIKFEMPHNAFFKLDNDKKSIKRHFIKFIDEKEFDYNKILKSAGNKKVLIICNTVNQSQEIYKYLKDLIKEKNHNTSINLLHSRFIMKDRKSKEEQIKNFAPNDENKRDETFGIWISTQIVEASLDIDFDELHTDMSAADSLLQRMGRVYRNRDYKKDEPNIFIYNSENGVPYVYDKEIYKRTVDYIKSYDNKIFTEEDKQDFINKVYDYDELENSEYLSKIKKSLEQITELTPAAIDKGKCEDLFRKIDNVTVMPLNIYKDLISKENNIIKEYEELLNLKKLTKEDYEKLIRKKKELLGFTTSIKTYKRFKSNTNIEINLNRNKNNKIFIVDLKYDDEFGLLDKKDDSLMWD
ncbi:CRISPR-associated helicase Cas3' [Brachyspira pulli]|uniref:CRISPR-associated helicase Cas3' n=1 Tax=Brachyspira pulli TaxID=310721 RepID=UPI00300752C1